MERNGFDLEAIKAAHPLSEFFVERGVVLKAAGAGVLQGKCPFHHEQHGAALTVWPLENKWRCFGKCDVGGDVIEAVMRLDGVDFKEACERLGGRPATPTAAPAKSAALTSGQRQMQASASRALAADNRWCEGIEKRRGWLAETVRGMAMDGHLGLHEGKLAFLYDHGMKLRWQAGSERRIAWIFGGNSELWRMDRLAGSGAGQVIVCEGETDAISLIDAGVENDKAVAVVAIPGASCWRPEWTAMLAGRDVIVATDADEAGEKAARRILDAVAGTVRTVARLNPLHLLSEDRRDGAKDIGDAHERLGRDALREAVVNFALHLPQESGKSAKWEAGEGDFSDFNDFAPEDSGEIEEPEPFPIHCLPGVAGEMARGVAKSAMVPEVLAGMNVLGILSAAIGAGLEVASGGNRRTRGNLFLMPVAKSGTGKGQSFGPIAEPFLKMEAERVAQWQRTDRPEARADKAVAEARLGKLTGDAKKNLSSEEKANLLRDMADCHAEIERAERCLREPAWSTEQATKEAIESLIATATHETLASLSAEARGAVDVLMGRYREATDESIFLAGYSGDPVKVHRKGSPPVILARPCLSLLWMLQPDKLRELLESPAMSESGLLPRFLLADTKAEPQEEPEDWPVLSEATADKWRQLVLALVDEYREVDVAARVVTPERQAAALLRNYTNETAVRRRKGGDLEDVDIFAARWAENAWRLAVVLHAAERGDDAWRESLSVDTAERALCLMRWFAGQQLALLAAGREEKMKKRLERLQEVLKLKPEERCNLSELERRHAFTAAEVERLANKFPAVLVIERITTGGAGRPPLVARLLPIQKGKK